MTPAKFIKGNIVTWGSGAPRGRIVREGDGCFDVVLIQDLKTPCDHVFRAGTEVQMSDGELRLVN